MSEREQRHEKVQQILKWLKILGLPTSTGGIAGTIALINAGNYKLAVVTALVSVAAIFLAVGSKFVKKLLEQVIDEIENRLEKRVKPLADWIVNQLENLIVKLWWTITSKFQGKYYQNLIYTYRTAQPQGLKTLNPFTVDLEKIFVPLQVESKSPTQVSPDIIAKQTSVSHLSIWDFLAESFQESASKKIAIIGGPGSGKTTLLQYLTLTYAQNTQNSHHRKAPKLIPVLLYLREIHSKIVVEETPSLAELITQLITMQKSALKLNPPPQWFEEKLRRGKCLVMLDGLDEVADETKRREISKWVDRQMQDYPESTFILTSRPFGYRNAQLQQVRIHLEVQPFNLQQMEQFLHNWYGQNEILRQAGRDDLGVRQEAERKALNLIERIKIYPPLATMALNPLLLTMIATVHSYRGALPGRRVELYAEICDVLLGRRQEAKGMVDSLTAPQKKAVLQVLALALMENNTREFTLQQGRSFIQNELAEVAGTQFEPKTFFKNIENLSGLLVEKEQGIYEFAHKSFQEYLAGVQIKETNQESILTNNMNNPWWDETIRLYAAQSDASNLIRTALENPTVVSLRLAYDCLEEGLRVNLEIQEYLKDKLEDGLASSEPEIATMAAQVKLARRLNKLLRVDENLEIDTSYITGAEYQLFIDEHLKTGERLMADKAKNPITGISFLERMRFCAWLTLNAHQEENNLVYFYRSVTKKEAEQYTIKDSQELSDSESGIRIVKQNIPPQYNQLVNYLAQKEWQKADLETASLMLKIARREKEGWLDMESLKQITDEEIFTIDWLWATYSDCHFGFSVQKKIWQGIRKPQPNNEVDYKIYQEFGECLGWCVKDDWLKYDDLTFSLNAPAGHLPYPNKKYSRRIWKTKAWESFLVLLQRF